MLRPISRSPSPIHRFPLDGSHSGRGSGMVGYNVQAAARYDEPSDRRMGDNVGADKSHLAELANQAKAALETENIEAFADRGYFKGEEILTFEEAGITVTLPPRKPQTSEAESRKVLRRAGFPLLLPKRTFPHNPFGEKLIHRASRTRKMDWSCTRYWSNACRTCALKAQCH